MPGAELTLVDRDAAGLDEAVEAVRSRGATVLPYVADLVSPTAGDEIVGAAARRFSRITAVISNAGVIVGESLSDMSAGRSISRSPSTPAQPGSSGRPHDRCSPRAAARSR
jgi:NAD(P)-dependent dehydrogenase (short-subunit alcohol dehydrogenase family)